MIFWMTEATDRILDKSGFSVVGFDPMREGAEATCLITREEDDSGWYVCLGDVRGLTEECIDRRFCAAFMALAVRVGDSRMEEVGDALLAQDVNAVDDEAA